MMKSNKNIRAITTLTFILLFGYGALNAEEKAVTIQIQNDSDLDRIDEAFSLDIKKLNVPFPVKSSVIWDGKDEIPSQIDDLNGDLSNDEIVFVLNMPSHSTKTLRLILSSEKQSRKYPSRVYAEMMLHEGNIPIHSLTVPSTSNPYNQLLHHGPAFESELTAYRIYFDPRQTVDIYGKFNKGIEIDKTHFYPNDEQLSQGFGDDVLMVGNSCGAGALRLWDGKRADFIEPYESLTETIVSYGPVRTVVDVFISGWEHRSEASQIRIRYILYAGHRDCEVQISFSEPPTGEFLCTGVEKIRNSASFSDHSGLIASWGEDWPVTDTVKYKKETVGLATCIPADVIRGEATDADNYLYVLNLDKKSSFTYHIMFTSKKETFGFPDKEAWFDFAQKWKKRLFTPCKMTINL